MFNFVMSLLVVLGIGIAVFGIGIEFLLPGGSPGLNLPQLMIIVSGLALSLAAALMRRRSFRRRFPGFLTKKTLAAVVIAYWRWRSY